MFPLYYFLIPYLFFLAVGLLFLFFNLFHLGQYGLDGLGTQALMLLDVVVFAGLVMGSLVLFSYARWDTEVNIGDFLPTSYSVQSSF